MNGSSPNPVTGLRRAGILCLAASLTLAGLALRPSRGQAGAAPARAGARPAAPKPGPPYTCRRAAGAITLDGKLDEADWARAAKIANLRVPPTSDYVTGDRKLAGPARSRTLVRLLWNDDALYVGAVLSDLDVYGVSEGHDTPFAAEDMLELFVKPGRRRPEYWEIHVMPTGATRDYFYARRGAGYDIRWMPYNTGMEAAVAVDGTLNEIKDRDRAWTVEMKVPFSAFEEVARVPKVGGRWTFMVSRYDYSVHLPQGVELSASAPLPRLDYHMHEFYSDLVFAD